MNALLIVNLYNYTYFQRAPTPFYIIQIIKVRFTKTVYL